MCQYIGRVGRGVRRGGVVDVYASGERGFSRVQMNFIIDELLKL